jgi:hypothetical protein
VSHFPRAGDEALRILAHDYVDRLAVLEDERLLHHGAGDHGSRRDGMPAGGDDSGELDRSVSRRETDAV